MLSKCRFIIIEHILPTTECMINLLADNGAEIFAIVAKPYSIDFQVMERLKVNYSMINESYYSLENSTILIGLLNTAIDKSKEDNKAIILFDVGGYFSEPLQRNESQHIRYIYGVVEDTTFGHNKYIKNKDKIPIPIFSVARSDLKQIEARFVGQDAILAIESVLRERGIMLSGRYSLVIGYGMIGKNVAIALRNNNLKVSVYDKHDHKNLEAYIDGFNIHKKKELLKNADIIFLATGDANGALTYEEIEECKNNVILVSVGSKDTEFDLKSIKEQSNKQVKLSKYLTAYTLSNDKHIVVVKDGTAVNFLLPSLPVEILDLVFSEILLCAMLLVKNHDKLLYTDPAIIIQS